MDFEQKDGRIFVDSTSFSDEQKDEFVEGWKAASGQKYIDHFKFPWFEGYTPLKEILEVSSAELTPAQIAAEYWSNLNNNQRVDLEAKLSAVPDKYLRRTYGSRTDYTHVAAICDEMRRRGLLLSIDFADIANVPFGTIVKFAWKWWFAMAVASLPCALLTLIIWLILTSNARAPY